MTASRSSLVTRYSSRFTPRLELAIVVALLLLSFFFRTYELAGLGLGLEHDEVAEWQIANNIRQGENALFFKEAYGQEPLFLYLMAGSTALIGDNVMAIRFTSVFVAMLTLAVSYRLLRRMFFSKAFRIEFDKAGRILIPQPLREAAHLVENAVVTGVDDTLEIWAAELWAEQDQLIQDGKTNAERFAALNLPLRSP